MISLTLDQRLHVVIVVFGSIYLWFLLMNTSTLSFHELYTIGGVETSILERHGFVSFLNWMESSMLAITDIKKLFNTQEILLKIILEHMDLIMQKKIFLKLSKVGLQCGLLLFLYKVKGINKKIVIPTMSLSILTLICWKMTQSCMRDIITITDHMDISSNTSILEYRLQFLYTLFLLRWGAIVCIHLIFARGYQVYFCPWPERWIQIPRYLGSKNLMISTLYFGTAIMSLIALVAPNLRCLTEAASQIESLALGASVIHYIGRLSNSQDEETVDPALLKKKNE
jgi:hypothetical protein